MPNFCDFPYEPSYPYQQANASNPCELSWLTVEHLLPAVEMMAFDRLGRYAALYLHGGFIQLCEVICGQIIPQNYLTIANSSGAIVCNALAWSEDAQRLVASISHKPHRQHLSSSDHQVLVWDMRSLSLCGHYSAERLVRQLEPISAESHFLCRLQHGDRSLLGVLDMMRGKMSILERRNGMNLSLQEVPWLSAHQDSIPDASAQSNDIKVLPSDYPVHACALGVDQASGQRMVYVVTNQRGTDKCTLDTFSIHQTGSNMSLTLVSSLSLDVLSRDAVHLSYFDGKLLLCVPAAYLYQIYTLSSGASQILYPPSIPKDANFISGVIVARKLVLILFQHSARLCPSVKVIAWGPTILQFKTSFHLQSVFIQPAVQGKWAQRLVLGIDGTGKVRRFPNYALSSFAGAMYPVGYRLIHKIENYQELEDEFDKLPVLCEAVEGDAAATMATATSSGQDEAAAVKAAVDVADAVDQQEDILITPSHPVLPDGYLTAIPFTSTPLTAADLHAPKVNKNKKKSTDSLCTEDSLQEGMDEDTSLLSFLQMPGRLVTGDFQANLLRKRTMGETILTSSTSPTIKRTKFLEFKAAALQETVHEVVKTERRKLATAERQAAKQKAKDNALMAVINATMKEQEKQQQILAAKAAALAASLSQARAKAEPSGDALPATTAASTSAPESAGSAGSDSADAVTTVVPAPFALPMPYSHTSPLSASSAVVKQEHSERAASAALPVDEDDAAAILAQMACGNGFAPISTEQGVLVKEEGGPKQPVHAAQEEQKEDAAMEVDQTERRNDVDEGGDNHVQ